MTKGSGNLSSLVASGEARVQARSHENAATNALRQKALDAFLNYGFKLRGREDWKYSDVKLFDDGRFVPLIAQDNQSSQNQAGEIDFPDFPDVGQYSLVFINGVFSAQHSKIDELPEGVKLGPMAGATSIELGKLASFEESPFVALNTAFWNDGLLLELAPEVTLDQPINLHFLTDKNAAGKFVTARNLIHAGRGSKATIIEHFSGQVGDEYLHAPVTEVFCAAESDIIHLKIINEEAGALHLGSTHVRQAEGSRYASREFAMSGTLVRRELHLDLEGSSAQCDLTALSMAGGNESRDMRTRVAHLVSGCETHELYKGLFDDHAKGIFDGKILVARDAQQTNAHQSNRNLLLSDDAVSNSIPRLEIYADDVKCSHGSTTGQLDDNQVFFLRSRGFDALTARVMLAKAFANEILEGVSDTGLRTQLDAGITARLAHSLKGK